MNSTVHALRAEILQTRLSLRRFVCSFLELELELAQDEKARQILARRWIKAITGCYVLQLEQDPCEERTGELWSWNLPTAKE